MLFRSGRAPNILPAPRSLLGYPPLDPEPSSSPLPRAIAPPYCAARLTSPGPSPRFGAPSVSIHGEAVLRGGCAAAAARLPQFQPWRLQLRCSARMGERPGGRCTPRRQACSPGGTHPRSSATTNQVQFQAVDGVPAVATLAMGTGTDADAEFSAVAGCWLPVKRPRTVAGGRQASGSAASGRREACAQHHGATDASHGGGPRRCSGRRTVD